MKKKTEKKPMDIGTKVAKVAKAQKKAEKQAAAEGKAEGRRMVDKMNATGRPDQRAKEGMSGLDAAALVLKETQGVMNAKELVAEIQRRGIAPKLGGKTPHATIYAAMITEIAKKGDEARFRRVDKGTFSHA